MLKFKIFDHQAKIWCKEHSLGTHNFSNYVLSEEGKVFDFVGNYVNQFYSVYANQEFLDLSDVQNPLNRPRYTICPWIGIKDSYNDLIYSGDIIELKLVEKPHRLVVKYNYDDLMWVFCNESVKFPWQMIKTYKIKVAGNVLNEND